MEGLLKTLKLLKKPKKGISFIFSNCFPKHTDVRHSLVLLNLAAGIQNFIKVRRSFLLFFPHKNQWNLNPSLGNCI